MIQISAEQVKKLHKEIIDSTGGSYGIIRNHPFADGNKRTGMHVMMVLLKLNNINVHFTNDEVVKIGLELAAGEMSDKRLNDIIIAKRIG
ncbi:hypothetical protein R80B4_00684 [Fibrobacteres bacterium R8-0-B4]